MAEFIADRYKVKRLLGEGAAGKVFLVADKSREDRRLALKLLRTPGARHLELLRHEFSILRSLHHPNLAKAQDFGFDRARGLWFYTCEYIEGTEITRTCKKLSFAGICSLFAQILRALQYIHSQGIIHYDLKPAHLLVGQGGAARIIDFGLAVRQAPLAGTMRGTVGYAAPEVVRGEQADPRADLYSLGVVLYEALTGRRPFEGESALEVLRGQARSAPPPPRKFRRRIPAALEQVVLHLLEREPSSRYQSANEVIRALSRAVDVELDEETAQTAMAYLLSGGFVGRDKERESLTGLVDSLADAGPQPPLLFITGELGIGKSRLLNEVEYHAQLQGINLVRGSCGVSKGVPFGPFAEAVRMGRGASAFLKGAQDSQKKEAAGRAGAMHDTALLLMEGAKQEPMVISIDDLEHGDDDTLSLIEHIARLLWLGSGEGGQARLLMICACNTQLPGPGAAAALIDRITSLGFARRTALGGLSREAGAQMLSNMLGRAELPEQMTNAVLDAAGGNPLIIEQMVGHLLGSGVLFYEAGKWRASATLAELRPPGGGEEALRQRIEALSADERAAVESLACIGRPAEFELLCEAAGIAPEACAAALSRLVIRRFLASDEEGRYVFKSGHAADVALKGASPGHRAGIHGRIYSFLEREAANREETDTGLIDRALQGNMADIREEKLLPLLREAARRAEDTTAAASASRIHEALLRRLPPESQEWFHALERLSDLYWRSARTGRMLECLHLALREALWEYPEIAVKIISRFVASHLHSGKLQEAEALVREAMERMSGPSLRRYHAKAALEMAGILQAKGEMKGSREFLMEARDEASEHGDSDALESIDYRLVLLDFRLRNLDEAGSRALSMLRRKSALNFYPGLHNLLGLVSREKGNSSKALEEFQIALRLYEKEGNLSAMSYVHSNVGLLLYDNGEYEQALDAYATAKRSFSVLADDIACASALVSIGKAQAASGRVEEALSSYDGALKLEKSAASPVVRSSALICRAAALSVIGRTRAALGDLDAVIEDVRKSGAANIEMLVLSEKAYVLAFLCGDLKAAGRDMAGARSLKASDFPMARAEVLALSARLSLLEGKNGEALQFVREAQELEVSGPARRLCLIARAQVVLAGDEKEAVDELLDSLAQEGLTASEGVRLALLRGRHAFALGDTSKARQEAIHALSDARRIRDIVLTFEAALSAAEYCHEEGDGTLALQYGAYAEEVFEAIAAELPDGCDRRQLRSLPLYGALDSLQERIRVEKPEPAGGEDDFQVSRDALSSAGIDERLIVRDGLVLLGMVTRLAAAELGVEKLLSLALGMLLDLTRAQRGFIILVNEDGTLEHAAARNIDDEEITSPEYQTSHTMVRKVLETGRPRLISDAMLDKLLRNAKSVVDLGLRSVLCVPIEHEKRIIGVVYLDTTSLARTFTDADLILVQAFAERIAPVIIRAVKQDELQVRLHSLQEEVRTRYAYTSIVGRSKPMRELFRLLDSTTDTKVAVYIYGETGTGKELVAKALHYNSRRKDARFVSINCAALPEPLLESELFGYAKGAFTGADSDKAGLIETAGGGTLFLDEIGIMPLEMQVKFLRVIEEQQVRRIGSTIARSLDLRVVCAANMPLEKLVEEGAFREDLFYRINVVRVELPPLRERREDIPLLVEHFLEELAREQDVPVKQIDKKALARLYAHNYPGNVRQLRNLVQQAFITSGERITESEIDAILRSQKHAPEPQTALARELSVEDYVKEYILANQERYSETELARKLGVSRTYIWQKRKSWNLPRKK